VPISRYYGFEDARAIQEVLKGYDESSDGGQSLDTPLKVIGQVSRCRIVVTGAYHSAVFALSQGIPTVCLAKSAYFVDKLMGLADQFGTGCEVVLLDSDLAENLRACLEKTWNSALEVRPSLLAAAREQIRVGQDAYKRLGEIALISRAAL